MCKEALQVFLPEVWHVLLPELITEHALFFHMLQENLHERNEEEL